MTDWHLNRFIRLGPDKKFQSFSGLSVHAGAIGFNLFPFPLKLSSSFSSIGTRGSVKSERLRCLSEESVKIVAKYEIVIK